MPVPPSPGEPCLGGARDPEHPARLKIINHGRGGGDVASSLVPASGGGRLGWPGPRAEIIKLPYPQSSHRRWEFRFRSPIQCQPWTPARSSPWCWAAAVDFPVLPLASRSRCEQLMCEEQTPLFLHHTHRKCKVVHSKSYVPSVSHHTLPLSQRARIGTFTFPSRTPSARDLTWDLQVRGKHNLHRTTV